MSQGTPRNNRPRPAEAEDGATVVTAPRSLEAVEFLDLPPELSPWKRARRRFMSHKLAVLGLAILLNMVLISIFAEFVAPYDPTRNHLHKLLAPPDSLNWLGTDRSGRDTFSRVVYGSRVSLSVGVVAVSIYLAIAFAIGASAGLAGGRVDNVLMRFTDLVMTFPSFILIVIMAGILGPSIINVMVIIGIFGWPGLARLIRGQILVQRELDYVIASQALGGSLRHIIRRHVLPNVVGPVSVAVTLGVAGAILAEAGLSFLGLGISEPAASWGTMISNARGIAFIDAAPALWLSPGLSIVLAVLAIYFVGDGLRDAFDVRGSGSGN